MNKKAALELSINAIVIVILAMTLLGLGLGFINNMMGNVLDLSTGTFEKMKDQLQQSLLNSEDKLVFSQSKFSLQRGKSSLEGYGIRNEEDSILNYGIKFLAADCPEDFKINGTCKSIDSWFQYLKQDESYSAGPGDFDITRVDIKIPRAAKTGDYLISVEAYTGRYKDRTPLCSKTNYNTEPLCEKALCDWINDGTTTDCIPSYFKYASTEIFLTVE